MNFITAVLCDYISRSFDLAHNSNMNVKKRINEMQLIMQFASDALSNNYNIDLINNNIGSIICYMQLSGVTVLAHLLNTDLSLRPSVLQAIVCDLLQVVKNQTNLTNSTASSHSKTNNDDSMSFQRMLSFAATRLVIFIFH